jgi:hypothetical protein
VSPKQSPCPAGIVGFHRSRARLAHESATRDTRRPNNDLAASNNNSNRDDGARGVGSAHVHRFRDGKPRFLSRRFSIVAHRHVTNDDGRDDGSDVSGCDERVWCRPHSARESSAPRASQWRRPAEPHLCFAPQSRRCPLPLLVQRRCSLPLFLVLCLIDSRLNCSNVIILTNVSRLWGPPLTQFSNPFRVISLSLFLISRFNFSCYCPRYRCFKHLLLFLL